jgi:hypothetical protein
MTEDIVAMARAAQRDDRLADGALYRKLADRIEMLEQSELNELAARRQENASLRAENERLRTKIEELDKRD